MNALLIIVFLVLASGGLLLILLGLPGTLLILAAAAGYAFFRDFGAGDMKVLLILAGLSLLAELLEYLVTYVGARQANVPRDVIAISMLGGIIGAIIGAPVAIIGSILGMFAGLATATFAYALFKNHNPRRAWEITKACLISRTIAIATKFLVGLVMIGYAIWAF